MIISPDILFIQIPKTAGASCNVFLCEHLRGPVGFFSIHSSADNNKYFNATLYPGFNHETLAEVFGDNERVRSLSGLDVHRVKKILAVIRHPYELEVSTYLFFKNAQKNSLQVLMNSPNISKRIELAKGSFKNFVEASGYFRKESENSMGGKPYRTEDYLLMNGQLPDNLEILKFEEIQTALPAAIEPFMAIPASGFPHKNRSQRSRKKYAVEPDSETRKLIVEKHRWVFEQGFYLP